MKADLAGALLLAPSPPYLRVTGATALDTRRLKVVDDFPKVDPSDFAALEHAKLD